MIDWPNLLYNTLWILALAIALAAVSFASWRASVEQTKLRTELAKTGSVRTLEFAGLLFSLGLALTASAWWEKGAWFLFAGYFAVLLAWPLVKKNG